MRLSSTLPHMDQPQRYSLFLIDMPISTMLLVTTNEHLFILHHRMAIINASSSFLIDMPISMLSPSLTTHLFILRHRVAIINASKC